MAHPAGAWRAGTGRLGQDGAVPGPVAEDRSAAVLSGARTVRSWPLLVLAAPAATEVWSGWVGIAQKTGFGLVSPHTLRHSTAMALLRAGVDTSVIALWLGHESPETTQAARTRRHGDQERALARVNPPGGTPGRYSPPDSLIAYLKTL